MSSILDSVNQRTQLVGQNRLELLLFRLNGDQIYGINVFKVREVLRCPELSNLPQSHHFVAGVATIRGMTVPVIDLSSAIGLSRVEVSSERFVVLAEYNQTIQGFLVSSVDRIVNLNWEDIHQPPAGIGNDNYLTAVCQLDDGLVEILDVEKVIDKVNPRSEEISEGIVTEETTRSAADMKVLIVDDSVVARKQVKKVCDAIGIESTLLKDGREAINHLLKMIEDGCDPLQEYTLVISDIEMPEMDGYTLTAEIRRHPALMSMPILLHTSLSGVFNEAMVQKVGADKFLAKYSPDLLAAEISSFVERRAAA